MLYFFMQVYFLFVFLVGTVRRVGAEVPELYETQAMFMVRYPSTLYKNKSMVDVVRVAKHTHSLPQTRCGVVISYIEWIS